MDPFSFQEELLPGEFLWAFSPELFDLTPPPPVVQRRSAFVGYSKGAAGGLPVSNPGSGRNIHRRVIKMLRRIPMAKPAESRGGEESRVFRHMMRERQRREKLSQSYADLYAMLSPRSKADKNSIVQSAAMHMRELKGAREELTRRNEELKSRLARCEAGTQEKIKIQVTNPSSAMDSMIAALRLLKSMDVKATAIRSDLSDQKLSAVVSIQTNQTAAELEKAVEGALMEVEQKLRPSLPRRSGWSQQCHVENT